MFFILLLFIVPFCIAAAEKPFLAKIMDVDGRAVYFDPREQTILRECEALRDFFSDDAPKLDARASLWSKKSTPYMQAGNLKLFIQCVEDQSGIGRLKSHQVASIFQVGHYLGGPASTMQLLAVRLQEQGTKNRALLNLSYRHTHCCSLQEYLTQEQLLTIWPEKEGGQEIKHCCIRPPDLPTSKKLALYGSLLCLTPYRDLNVISFFGNELATFACSDFAHLRSLRSLDLRNNRITTLTRSMFQDMPTHDFTLLLGKNPITVIEPGCFSQLNQGAFQRCRITLPPIGALLKRQISAEAERMCSPSLLLRGLGIKTSLATERTFTNIMFPLSMWSYLLLNMQYGAVKEHGSLGIEMLQVVSALLMVYMASRKEVFTGTHDHLQISTGSTTLYFPHCDSKQH